MTNNKYGKIFAIATAVCVIALGLAFMICCAHLYFTGGDNPFSRESVGEYLIVLAIPSFITIALAIGGFIYAYVNKLNDDELTPRTSLELLQSFESRFVFEGFDPMTKYQVLKLRNLRNFISVIATIISAYCSVLILDYFLLIGSFSTENLNRDIMSAFAFVLPLSVIAAAIHIPKIYFIERSAVKELALLKDSVKEYGAPALATKTNGENKINVVSIARYAILAVALVFIILGVMNGGMADVLGKAVRICTECIGLG